MVVYENPSRSAVLLCVALTAIPHSELPKSLLLSCDTLDGLDYITDSAALVLPRDREIRYLNGVTNKVASEWIQLYLLHFDTCKLKK